MREDDDGSVVSFFSPNITRLNKSFSCNMVLSYEIELIIHDKEKLAMLKSLHAYY